MSASRVLCLGLLCLAGTACPGDKVAEDDTGVVVVDSTPVDTGIDVDGDGYDASEDCDDTDAAISPGATETWYDGVDQDCDGLSDYDADIDGHDSDLYGGDDCDDLDAESRGGDVDELALGVGPDCGTAEVVALLLGEEAFDVAGTSRFPSSDVNGDGLADILIHASGNSRELVQAGIGYIVLSPVVGQHDLSEADAILRGSEAGARAGNLYGLGDNDGDGYGDLVQTQNVSDTLVAFVFHGPLLGELASESGDGWVGTTAEHGGALPGGDFDGDGLTDLVFMYSGTADVTGAIDVYTGSIAGERTSDDALARVIQSGTDQNCGGTSAGDTDADGLDDLLVSCSYGSEAYVFHGGLSGELTLGDADAWLATSESLSGTCAAGDTDGDGTDDLIFYDALADSSEGEDSAGRVWLFTSPAPTGEFQLSSAPSIWEGEGTRDFLEVSAADIDLDADGLDDMVFGVWDSVGGIRSTVLIMLSPGPGLHDMSEADWAMTTSQDATYDSLEVGAMGDTNGDGFPDLAVGESTRDINPADDPESDEGAIWIVLGGSL